MKFPIRAITFDLDDTLWPFAPIGERIETTLHAWFAEHSPRTAERFPIAEFGGRPHDLRDGEHDYLRCVMPSILMASA